MKILKLFILLVMSVIITSCTASAEELAVTNAVPTSFSNCSVGTVLNSANQDQVHNACYLQDSQGNEIHLELLLYTDFPPAWGRLSFDEADIAHATDNEDGFIELDHHGYQGTVKVSLTSTIVDNHYQITAIEMSENYVITDMACLESYWDLGAETGSMRYLGHGTGISDFPKKIHRN